MRSVMVGDSRHDDDGDHGKGEELKQHVLEPTLRKATQTVFEMFDTSSSFAFDAVELPLQPVDAPGWSGSIWVIPPALWV